MTKAVGYHTSFNTRASPCGYSLAYQRDEIIRYCAENGIELVMIYDDKGINDAKVDEDGLTVEREGLQSMLADLASVEVDCVIVLNTSLLWRSDMANVLIQRELKRHRIDVRAIEHETYSIYNYDSKKVIVLCFGLLIIGYIFPRDSHTMMACLFLTSHLFLSDKFCINLENT